MVMQTRGRIQRLYTPDSTFWHVQRELLVMLSGSRALLLEIAHPMIAAGVAQHSDFRRRPLRRLFSTVRVIQRLSFGGGQAVRQGTRDFHQCHHHVKGCLTERVGQYADGAGYDAADPQLRLWVLATMIESILLVYDQFVQPLDISARADYYEGSKTMARLMGLTSAVMPATYEAFQDYVQTTLNNGTLAVGESAREISHALFHHPILGPGTRLVGYAGIGLLPDHLREAYGFRWTDRDQNRLVKLSRLTRRVRPFVPDFLAVQPEAWLVERGFAGAQ